MELEANTPKREHLALATELAAIVRPSWDHHRAVNAREARFLNETPEGGTPAETPAPETSPETQAPAPEASTDAPGIDTPFRLEEVPEEYRPHVERYINATRPAVTRAFQSAAEQRQAAQEALELAERLESPDTAYDALVSVLGRYGLELPEEAWEQALNGDEYEPGEEPGAELPEEVKYLIERERQREAAEEAESQDAARQAIRTTVNEHLTDLARKRYGGDEATHADVPEPIRNSLAAFAAVLPAGTDGLPNMKAAQEQFDAAVALEVERVIRAKTPTPPPAGGGPGERRMDVKNEKDRYAMADEIAARHFSGSAT
jgi:hypothetical protein